MAHGAPFAETNNNYPGHTGVQAVLTLSPSRPETLLIRSVSAEVWVPTGQGVTAAVVASGSPSDIPFGIQYITLFPQGPYGTAERWSGNHSVFLWVKSPGKLTFSAFRYSETGYMFFAVAASGYYET